MKAEVGFLSRTVQPMFPAGRQGGSRGSQKSLHWAILRHCGLGRGLWQVVSMEWVQVGKGATGGGKNRATVARRKDFCGKSLLVQPSSPLTS